MRSYVLSHYSATHTFKYTITIEAVDGADASVRPWLTAAKSVQLFDKLHTFDQQAIVSNN